MLMYIYFGVLFTVSFITFFLYMADKQKAKRHAWRIKESTLLFFGLFGGAAGALLGMLAFRHKTRHWYFWLINILALALQIAALFVISREFPI